ncbi:MAG: hypothetical protein ACE5FF_11865 [Saprospiraceae bacterium]
MKTTILLLFSFFFFQMAFSQNEDNEPTADFLGQINPHFTMGIPLQEFADAMDDNAIGLGVSFLRDLPGTPVSAGVQFDYLSFNHKKLRVTDPIGNTGFGSDYDWVTRSQALLMGLVFRLQPKHGFWLKPYMEGSAGWRRLFTNTILNDRNTAYNYNVGTDLDISDWSVYYSGAIGATVALASEVRLDMGCRFFMAPSADFYTKKKDAGAIEDPLDVFELKHSAATNMVLPEIGVSILIE